MPRRPLRRISTTMCSQLARELDRAGDHHAQAGAADLMMRKLLALGERERHTLEAGARSERRSPCSPCNPAVQPEEACSCAARLALDFRVLQGGVHETIGRRQAHDRVVDLRDDMQMREPSRDGYEHAAIAVFLGFQ